MTTITFDEDINVSSNKFKNMESFIDNFVENNYQNSGINDKYQTANDMENKGLPDTFIKNFVKSYD